MHSKGNYKQGEKTTLRMGENNNKWNNWQRVNFQNIQAIHTTQCQKNTHAPMGTLFLTKEARIYDGKKRAPSINGAGKTGQLHVKEWNYNTS